jgi:hypothetical protein
MKFKWTKRLAIWTPLFAIITIVTLGGGHGTPIPTVLLYPVVFVFNAFQQEFLVWIILLFQFPSYGLTIDLGTWKSKFRYVAIGLVLLLHATMMAIVINNEEFWKGWE